MAIKAAFGFDAAQRMLDDVVDAFGPQWAWFAKTIKVGAIIGLTSVVLVLMYGQTRIFYTMARDGLLPRVFSTVHPKFKTPWINTLIVGVLVALAAFAQSDWTVGDLPLGVDHRLLELRRI